VRTDSPETRILRKQQTVVKSIATAEQTKHAYQYRPEVLSGKVALMKLQLTAGVDTCEPTRCIMEISRKKHAHNKTHEQQSPDSPEVLQEESR
jgi:hypothetical protein